MTYPKCFNIVIFLLTLLISYTSFAKQTYHIPRVNKAPTIDAVLDNGEWSSASQVEIAYNINPGNSVPAPVRTIAYMMEDGERLYFAFRAYDPEPEKIRAYFRDRDHIFQDDFVGVVVDTFNDERRGFEFFVNPMGSQGDLTRDDNLRNEDSSWDTVWDSAGQVVDDGYIVEMSIPYRALRFTAGLDKQTWSIQFLRIYPRDSRFVLTDNKNNRELDCEICQYNKVSGMSNIESTDANFDITPTITYSKNEERELEPLGDWEETNNDIEIGADFRWAMTDDWILNATINPDFSQVEADAGQLDVNTTFSLFFPEARPFFLDGADYFNSMNRLVHTRNIADPDYGVKITGKSNGYALGMITASDDSTSFLIPSSTGSYVVNLEGESSDTFILRGQSDVGEKNNVGVLLTHRSATDYKNQLASVDGKYYFTSKDVLSYQLMHSSSDNPESIRFEEDDLLQEDELLSVSQSDSAYSLTYRHNEEDYGLVASYNDFGKNFRADMGFIGQVDFKKLVVGGNYIWRGDKNSKWTRWGVSSDWDKTEDQSGLLLEQENEGSFFIRGPKQFLAELGIVSREKYYNEEYFDENFYWLWLEIKPLPDLTLSSFIEVGDRIDFSNTQIGEQIFIEPSITWQITKHLSLNLNYVSQSFDVPGGELFSAKLTDLRVAYQFNNRSRLSLTIQSTDIDRNVNLYDEDQDGIIDNSDLDEDNDIDSKSGDFGTQLIYSYKLNSQSLFYFGYSDKALENDRVNSLKRYDKTIFAKFSYLWQS